MEGMCCLVLEKNELLGDCLCVFVCGICDLQYFCRVEVFERSQRIKDYIVKSLFRPISVMTRRWGGWV